MSHTVRVPETYPAHLELLFEMLQHKRPHKSETEKKFIEEYLRKYRPYEDAAGNLIVRIDGPGQNILWSCHTDTVHSHDGYQSIFITKAGIVSLAKESVTRHWRDPNPKLSNCLGADDTAGVWLMTQMIEAAKPGLYIFHRGEECGASGSRYIAHDTPEVLNGIDAAIALDRYGYESVITHQLGRCASDEFAQSLAIALPGIADLKPDAQGIFTDTKNYTRLVKECTNLSVGYFGHHTSGECVDSAFLDRLRTALIQMDPSTLVFKRDLTVDEDRYLGWGNGRSYGYSSWDDDYDTPARIPKQLTLLDKRADREALHSGLGLNGEEEPDTLDYDNEIREMAKVVEEDPIGVAELLYNYGCRYAELLEELNYSYGIEGGAWK